MKTRAWFMGITGLMILLLVSACSGSTPAQTTEASPSNSEVSSSSSSSEAGDSSSASSASAEDDLSGSQAASSDPSAGVDSELVSDETIKIGFLTPSSSIAAQSAQDMIDGFNLFWEQHGLEVAGRSVEIFIEDTAGDPDQALTKAQLLVEQRQVDILYGTVFANVGLAVADYMKGTETPFLVFAGADDLTQRNRAPNVIRAVNFASSAPHHVFGEWVANNTNCQSIYTIGSDYAFGHEVIGGFVNTFTDNGGTVQEQVWNPITEADFSSYLAAIQDAQPDCVFALEVGAGAIRFITAWNDFGLKDAIPLYLGEVPVDQSILRGIDPPELAEGLMSVGHYAEGLDNPATQSFVESYDERYGSLPSFYSVNAYTSAQWMVEAIEAVNGDLTSK